jgi:hypothetical protein
MTRLEPVAPMSSKDRELESLRAKVHAIMREKGHFDSPRPPALPAKPAKHRRLADVVRHFIRPQSGHTSPVRSANTGPHFEARVDPAPGMEETE